MLVTIIDQAAKENELEALKLLTNLRAVCTTWKQVIDDEIVSPLKGATSFKMPDQAYRVNLLGLMYLYARCVDHSSKLAMECFMRVGTGEAMYKVGKYYCTINGVYASAERHFNPMLAVEWYTKAAAQGNAFSLERLSHCYVGGIGGLSQDPVKADELHQQARDRGFVGFAGEL
ncbi:MAG: hypothetical protein KR126chlam2_00384 [Chlamydiae bacterium]|nr:hypothetical protein [Chlamydiota bacterium]